MCITKGYLDNELRDNIDNVFSLTRTSPQINTVFWEAPHCFHGNENKSSLCNEGLPKETIAYNDNNGLVHTTKIACQNRNKD